MSFSDKININNTLNKIKIGIIGFGYFGKKIHNKLCHPSLSDKVEILVICTHDYKTKILNVHLQSKLDWVFVATPNNTHYDIIKFLLKNYINVFCEKPLTYSPKQSEELINLAKLLKKKLYVDDVFNFRIEKEDMTFSDKEINKVLWKKFGSFKDTVLNNLLWHDLYLIYPYINDIFDIKIYNINKFYQERYKISFILDFHGKKFEMEYDVTHEESQTKLIGNVEFGKNMRNDALLEMITSVLEKKVDYEYNLKVADWCVNIISKIKKEIYPHIAVVGGGIFGTTTAIVLSSYGYNVVLYEKENDIHQCATGINQYRLHRGYHYPRSVDTAISSKNGELLFRKNFSKSLINSNEHYYAISSTKSKTSSSDYLSFMDEINLEYKILNNKDNWISNISLLVKVNESLIDPFILKVITWKELKNYNVDVRTGTECTLSDINKYNAYIIATYSNINKFLPQNITFQYELCEKIVLKLPDIYRNKSIVIIDGPFMCIDPYSDTGYHVMGNVVHAIHKTNIGIEASVPENYIPFLNKGIIKDKNLLKHLTKFDKFILSAENFFPRIFEAEHIGSMFTVRTVLPNRDHDDARPSYVKKIDGTKNGIYVFSGKICTSVKAAEKILTEVKDICPI